MIDRTQLSIYGAAISAFYAYCKANPQSFKFIPPSQAHSTVLSQTVLLKNDRGEMLARYIIASGEIIDVYGAAIITTGLNGSDDDAHSLEPVRTSDYV